MPVNLLQTVGLSRGVYMKRLDNWDLVGKLKLRCHHLSKRMTGFDPKLVHMEFMVEKVAMG
jgi:hypothetical protein